jgi:hypothetical protein
VFIIKGGVVMRVLKVGDKGKAICKSCKAVVPTTYNLRTVPFSDGVGEVKDVLVSTCNTCDHICSLPHQSTPAVKKALEKKRRPVECKVPAHMIDMLNMACAEVGCGIDFKPQLFKYYINRIANDENSSVLLAKNSKNELLHGKLNKRLSLKGRFVKEDLEIISNKTNIKKITDIIKLIVIQIGLDILENKEQKPIHDLKIIAAATL